jgi:hypothetical protein
MGSQEPELDARLVAHAVLGTLSDHLWQGTRPSRAEVATIVAFCFSRTGR